MDAKMIHELFETQAAKTPQTTALVFHQSSLTYRELDRRADELARRLRAWGVGPDVLVALFLERSLDMVVGILGVLKAGGAYVPLDPAHPANRIAAIVADAQPVAILTQSRLESKLPPLATAVILIDPDSSSISAPGESPPGELSPPIRASAPNDLAYVIYTSGSTGKPKGV